MSGLRRGVLNHIGTLVGNRGGGPSSLPDLILNPKVAVVKANGFPYAAPMTGPIWHLLFSVASSTPATTLLEIIWTRLHLRIGGHPEALFGEDLGVDTLVRLADYEYIPSMKGWEVRSPRVSSKVLRIASETTEEWQPMFLDDTEAAVLGWLRLHDQIDLANPPDSMEIVELTRAVQRLTAVRLVGPDAAQPSVYRYLTRECWMVVLPDGRIAAGENVSGRLSRWLLKNMPAKVTL